MFNDDCAEFQQNITGEVLLPNTSGYNNALKGYQTAFHNNPKLIVVAHTDKDICAAVRFAKAHQLGVGAESTGHGRQRYQKNCVLIKTSLLKQIEINPKDRTATIEAGATWGEVIAHVTPYDLAPLNGSASGVGVVGYLLGGGLGLLCRQFGYSADHVCSIELVDANGDLQVITPNTHQDLYWAMLGCGANFGIVTKIKIHLFPITTLYAGSLYFAGEHIDRVLHTYTQWTKNIPNELTSSISIVEQPNFNMIPESIRGKLVAHIRVAYNGPIAEGERLVASLRQVAPRLLDTVDKLSYANVEKIYNDPPFPHAYRGDNVFVDHLNDEILDLCKSYATDKTAALNIVDIRHLGGALKEQPKLSNCIGHREANYLIRILSPTTDDDLLQVKQVHQNFIDDLKAVSIGKQLNFTYGLNSQSNTTPHFFSKKDFQKLQRLKKMLDPDNLFRLNYNLRSFIHDSKNA